MSKSGETPDVLGEPVSAKAKAGKAVKEEKAPPVAPIALEDALHRPVTGAKTVNDGLVTIVFKRSYKRYYAGDRAGFSQNTAKALVDAGVATYAKGVLDRIAGAVKPKPKSKGR